MTLSRVVQKVSESMPDSINSDYASGGNSVRNDRLYLVTSGKGLNKNCKFLMCKLFIFELMCLEVTH